MTREARRPVRLTARESPRSWAHPAETPHPTRTKSPDRAMAIGALDIGSPMSSGHGVRGSSGRIRTYNPPVNSRVLYH